MNNQERLFSTIKERIGECNKIAVPSFLIHMLDDIKAAVFLSQLVYWSDKGKRRDGYIFKSGKEWEIELGLSKHELARVRKLVSPYVEEKLVKANGTPTIHYRLRINGLLKAINEFPIKGNIDLPETGKSEFPESGQSLTDITQKEQEETTAGYSSIEDDWKYPDPDSCSFGVYRIQQKILRICKVDEFDYGQKEEIKRIEQGMAVARNHSGSEKARFDPEFVNAILSWCDNTLIHDKPMTVKRILKALLNDENFKDWSKPQSMGKGRTLFRNNRSDFWGRNKYKTD